ncbi:HD domain-containing protein [Nocardia callitridis]|uniref:HD domain-containing protein n=1 Tax=Nocardia callitridis TaxID=648753 RepID=A0ABP9JUN4_9NOCA
MLPQRPHKNLDDDLVAMVRNRVAQDFDRRIVAHDLSHLDRVARLAKRIAEAEAHDTIAPQLVAYVHDYHRIAESELGRQVDSTEVIPRIHDLLTDLAVPADTVTEIEHAVLFNEKYTIKGHQLSDGSTTAKITRDADKLDAIGAIGIARAFMYGGASSAELWDPTAELQETYKSGPTTSVIAHFYEKLLRLPNEMLTNTGKHLAEKRTAYLIDFLRRFHQEWGDESSAPINREEFRTHPTAAS